MHCLEVRRHKVRAIQESSALLFVTPPSRSGSPYKGTGVEADIVRPQHDGKNAFPKAQVQKPYCE
jgi:hypothetical protein